MLLTDLVGFLDEYLRTDEVGDSQDALNGLQVENGGEVTRVAVAVDASAASIASAKERGCDLLLVHHGLFWGKQRRITGRWYRRLRTLLDGDIAVYAAHLPLDLHPVVGNNAVLARELGVKVKGRFGEYEGQEIGVWGELELKRETLTARLADLLGGPVRLLPGGPELIQRVGVITGGGGSLIQSALDAGLDAYVTGEGAHHTYFDALEGGLNVYYGGHYATETWGVKALAAELENRFGLPWDFLDLPTGL